MVKRVDNSGSRKDLNKVKKEIKDLKKELEKTKNIDEKKDYSKKIKELIDDKIELSNLNNEIKELKEKLSKTKTAKTKTDYSKKTKELAESKKSLNLLKKEITKLKKKVTKKTKTNDNQKELNNLKKEIKNLKNKIQEKNLKEKDVYEKGINEIVNNNKELINLTNEIKTLKKDLAKTKTIKVRTSQNSELKQSMDSLSESMGKLVELFTTAKDIVDTGEVYENKNRQEIADLKPFLEQNKIIAKGILAITEMLREYLPKITSESRVERKYKILRLNKKKSSTPLPIEPVTREEPNIHRMRDSGLPSVPETDDDFEFSQGNEEEFNQ